MHYDTPADVTVTPELLETWRDSTIGTLWTRITTGYFADEDQNYTVMFGMKDVRVRDSLLWNVTVVAALTEDFSLWAQLREMLDTAVEELPLQTHMAGVYCGLAVEAWSRGDMACMLEYANTARDLDTEYAMADLLTRAASTDMPFKAWQEIMFGISPRQARLGREDKL